MPKLFAGMLFSIGFIFLAVTMSVVFTKNPTQQDREAALGGIIIGVPATAAGGWIVWGLKRKSKESQGDRQDQIERTFLEMVDANNGRVNVLKFAIASKLSLDESKVYLDRKAVILNAHFEVTDEGSVNYYFDLS